MTATALKQVEVIPRMDVSVVMGAITTSVSATLRYRPRDPERFQARLEEAFRQAISEEL
jgi:hypothetical protein